MHGLSVVIITLNEERNIGRCIDSVQSIADEVILLDSFSTDKTIEIARAKNALVIQQPFNGYIHQKNMAMQLAKYDYVLSLDADEALSPELANSISLVKKDFSHAGYSMSRSNFFCGQFIKHGLWYPDKKLRLFNRHVAHWGGYDPHDKILLDGMQPIKQLKGDLLHYAYYTIEEYFEKNEKISGIAARSMYEHGIRKHWSKIFLSPAWEFINGYFLRLGFLDGYYGFLIAVHTAKQSLMKHQHLQKLQKQIAREMAWEIK